MLLSIASLGAALYLYLVFVAFAAPDSHVRGIWMQIAIVSVGFLTYVYLIAKGVIKRRIHAWPLFLALTILVYFIN